MMPCDARPSSELRKIAASREPLTETPEMQRASPMRHRSSLRYLIAVATLFLSSMADAQLANRPPQPLWLVGSGASRVIEKHFTHDGTLLKAILLGASEHEAELSVNGASVGKIVPDAKAASLDVTRFVRAGDNVLRITARGRIAVLLELNGDLARKTWLASDAAWEAKTAAIDPQADPFDFTKTFDAYNSWQLAKPGAQNLATDAASLIVPEGFKAELIRSSSGEEGSWVAMAFDPQGRITLAREKRGLLRFDPKANTMAVIEDTLLECRGLLYADGVLFANANNSHALMRLRDTKGDGRFDEVREILHTEGGVGHGRNHIKLGPDGWIWVSHGNNVLLPKNLSSASPLQNYAPDQLLANPWDGTMFDGNVELPAGHTLRIKPDGSEVQLVAGGLRNPLDIAFDRNGELFTFDADMERDVGTAFYMPTRVLHIVPGADFGWRRGTGRQPAWYVDTLPSVVDIGLSSPTGIFFGYGAKFPARYQDALFCLDWSYGRILAVTMKPRGASWSGEQETFISGRPLNVTDGCIGPDGALWFITGGRGTQSGLYRVTWTGKPEPASEQRALTAEQDLRRKIERGEGTHVEIVAALGSDDAFLRHAAVHALESGVIKLDAVTPNESADGWAALSRSLVAARSGHAEERAAAMAKMLKLKWDAASTMQQLAALRILAIGIARSEAPLTDFLKQCLATFDPRFPANDARLNRELCRLLVYLKSPTIIAKSAALLKDATASEDLLFYPMHLRYLKEGWAPEQRRIVFDALNRAEKLNGASTYFKCIADTRSELAAALSPSEALSLADVINSPKPVQLAAHALPGHTFKNWRLADLEPLLPGVAKGRSFEKAKAALISSQCVFCHRVGNDPSLPAGVFGPDLTQVAARFGRRDLLMHILEPSLVIDEKYRSTTVKTTDGRELSGALDREDDERLVLKPNPLASDVTEIAKAQIKERHLSDVSPMPPGLLNTLKADQILDLLAWFETAGDPNHQAWAK